MLVSSAIKIKVAIVAQNVQPKFAGRLRFCVLPSRRSSLFRAAGR
jgi:hypothetical protein